MDDSRQEWKEALGELVADLGAAGGEHPTPEQLLAYRADELTGEEKRRIQDHLVGCSECLELLLDAEGFGEASYGAGRPVSRTEKAAAWRSLEARLEGRPARAPAARFRFGTLLRSSRTAYALAASLFLAAMVLSFRVAELGRTVEELTRPQLNAPVEDLFPTSSMRGEESPPPTLELAPESRYFTLILNPVGAGEHPAYRVEIGGPGGETAWSQAGLERTPYGSFTLILARRFLRPGNYRIRLFGRQEEGWQPLEEFPFRVVEAGR